MALDELVVLSRSDAIIVWSMGSSSYSMVAATWAAHRAGGQDLARSNPNQDWLGVFAAGDNCTRITDHAIEPAYANNRWSEDRVQWPTFK